MKIKLILRNNFLIKKNDWNFVVTVADDYHETRNVLWEQHVNQLLAKFGQKAEFLESLLSESEKAILNEKGKVTIEITK